MNTYPPPPTSPATWQERLTWYCCKVDSTTLEQSPNADRIMYQGLGWSILASSLIASVSSGYGIFLMTGETWLASLGFGVGLLMIWFCRYTISKRGIGDGTAGITLKEFLSLIPQIVLIILLGNTLSLPMEYVVLKSEIDVEIYSQLAKQKEDIRSTITAEFTDEQQTIRRSITKLQADITEQQTKHKQLLYELSKMKDAIENTPKHLRSRKSNDGPSWSDQVEMVERLQDQIALSEIQTNTAVQQLNRKIQREESKQQAISTKIHTLVESKIANLPQEYNFIYSIPYLQYVGGHIRLFIKGLLCSILLSPFIFMMMLSRNTYWIFKTQPPANKPDITGDFL